MPSTSAAAYDASAETSFRYRGWRVAAVSHVCVLVGFAAVFIYSFSLMVKPLQQEFGWNREEISRCFTIAALSVAVCSPFVGRLLDHVEPRKLIAACMAALGLGLAAMAALTPNLWQLYITAMCIGVAGSGTYQLGYARIIATWFERKLGAALSLVVAGSGLGSLLIPPLVERSIVLLGWRGTYLLLAALPLLIGAPLTWFFAPTAYASPARKEAAQTGSSYGRALFSRGFLLLALGLCVMSLAENGALAHLVPMLTDRKIAEPQAALVASIMGATSVAGRFLLGWLLDYLEGAHIAVLSLLCAGGGIYLLAHANSFSAAAIAALVGGLGMGCELDLIPYMLRRYFGLRSFSALYGSIYTVFAVSGGLAPLILGRIFDRTGSYTGILSLFALATVVAALAMLALPRYETEIGTDVGTGMASSGGAAVIAAPEASGALEGN